MPKANVPASYECHPLGHFHTLQLIEHPMKRKDFKFFTGIYRMSKKSTPVFSRVEHKAKGKFSKIQHA